MTKLPHETVNFGGIWHSDTAYLDQPPMDLELARDACNGANAELVFPSNLLEELHARALVVEGILSIQAGDNPRVVQEKLITFVPPSQRPGEGEATGGADAAKAAA